MRPRTRFQLGVSAVGLAFAAAVASCTAPPIGRTQYCYYYPTTTTSMVTTTTICLDEPIDLDASTTTMIGYVAPVPAGTRTVK